MDRKQVSRLRGGYCRHGMVWVAACLAWGAPALALEPHIGFTELTQTADIIFEGTVSNIQSRFGPTGRSIVTDVTFDIVQLIHRKDAAPQAQRSVVLTFAGGQVGDLGLTVSGVPNFTLGQHCVVFSLFDGQSYMNPLVGGAQGLFEVTTDLATGIQYPTTPSRRGLTGVSGDELRYSEKVEQIDNGTAAFALPDFPAESAPRSPLGDVEPAWSEAELRANDPATLMTLDDFIAEIRLALLAPPPANPVLRIAGRHSFEEQPVRELQKSHIDGVGGAVPRGALDGAIPDLRPWTLPDDVGAPVGHSSALHNPLSQVKPDSGQPTAEGLHSTPIGDGGAGERAALCYCGGFNLFLVMEQVPTNWWEWGENNDSMVRYNHFMDIYRYVADDGSYGNNNQNEFGGYPSNQDLINIYGQGWGSSIAVTWTFWSGCQCCTLTQADVFFNPAFSWWINLSDTLDQPGRVLYRPTVAHELGHSWGMQRGSCTEDYSYSQISVMHAYYNNIIEDGYGIHHPEAYSIRRLYSNQTPIINRKDVGVESYYASGSLINSTTNWSFYYTGDPITVNNVTVENNSNTATAGVRIRFFLSTNNIISTGDYQMGSYWEWSSFSAEAYNTSNYGMTIPNVPSGQYYVGMIVSTDGAAYNGDDLGFNNATYLKDRITVTQPPPGNDSCFSATAIGLGTVFGTTGGAGTDGSASCGSGTPDVWYSFVAPCSGILAVNSCGSNYDTIVSLHSGCPGSFGNELGCDDDCDGVPCFAYDSCFTANVVAGNTYWIRVSGFSGQTGDFALNLSFAPPANDASCNASLVYQGATDYSNCGATTDGPADCSAFADVWFVHEATCTGFLTVSLCGSAYDTYLGIYPYAGGTCPPISGSVVVCEDDDFVCGLQSHVVLPTSVGEAYFIRVGGWNGSTGEGVLNLYCGECGYDTDCDDGLYCNGAEACVEGTCAAGALPCVDSSCDEDVDACVNFGNGDFDVDGDVDLEDAAAFQWCYGQTAAPFCNAGNLAGDEYIDMSDYAAFEALLTGP